MNIQIILLCGGSGSRLWPESRKTLPKQFIPILYDKSLFQLTLERAKDIKSNKELIIVCNKQHAFFVKKTLQDLKIKAKIILEPEGRNTTAAIFMGTKFCDPDDNVIIMPTDHYIPEKEIFISDIKKIVKHANFENWITLGVKPTRPSTSYGYIRVKEGKKKYLNNVIKFIEKPTLKIAEKLFLQKDFFWNSGIFLGKASKILESIDKHSNDVAKASEKAFINMSISKKENEFGFPHELFSKIRSVPIDISVMEKETDIKLYPLNCKWSDLGSWDSFLEINDDQNFNKNVLQIDSKNNFIKNSKRVIATIGIEDAIIIDSEDATLVMKKNQSEKVKLVVDELNKRKLSHSKEHLFEIRPWGRFENLLITDYCKVKRLTIDPSARLSLQYHNFRSEHWLIVKGKAKIFLDKKILILSKGMSIDIPVRSQHYIENISKKELIIIETQLGTSFDESDIIRLDDPYDR